MLTSRTRSWSYEHNKDRYLLPSSHFLSLSGLWGFYKSTSYLLFPVAPSFSFCLLNSLDFIPISTCFSFFLFLIKNCCPSIPLFYIFRFPFYVYILYFFYLCAAACIICHYVATSTSEPVIITWFLIGWATGSQYKHVGKIESSELSARVSRLQSSSVPFGLVYCCCCPCLLLSLTSQIV